MISLSRTDSFSSKGVLQVSGVVESSVPRFWVSGAMEWREAKRGKEVKYSV